MKLLSLIGRKMIWYVRNISFTFVRHFFSSNFFFKVISWKKSANLWPNWDYNWKQFFQNFNYCFLFLVRYCLETCVNCVANCVTQKFTPLRSEFYKLFFSISFDGQLRHFLHISEPPLSKQFFSKLEFVFCFRFYGV